MQAAGADIFGTLVDLEGRLGDAGDAVLSEPDMQIFGAQKGLILLGERAVRLGQNAFEIVSGQRLQFDADRQSSL